MEWEDGNEYPVFKVEISSNSHPFYTGKQRAVAAEGRVQRFMKRYGKKDAGVPVADAPDTSATEASAE